MFGGAGLVLLSAVFYVASRNAVPRAIGWLASWGRSSMTIFILQSFIYFSLYSLIDPRWSWAPAFGVSLLGIEGAFRAWKYVSVLVANRGMPLNAVSRSLSRLRRRGYRACRGWSMSIARKTVVGAIWHVITSVVARVIGVVGTWGLTWMLEPSVVGEVGVAVIMVTTARLFTSFGMGQFVVANPKVERGVVFHATIINLCCLALASVVVMLFGRPLAPLFHAQSAVRYLPGILVSTVIIGVAEIPERILMRDMRFRLYGGSVAFGEVVYAATSVALAALGYGGTAIVLANVARSSARFMVSLIAVDRASWLTPATIERQHLSRILRFGTPLLAANVSGHISSRWDNLIVSAMFGPAAMGAYNQAYNLANIPSETLGETAADVLLPSFAQVPVKQRRYAFLEAIALLGLIIFPLAVGLGVVARPLVATLFSVKWQGVAPLLALLSFMSVSSHLQRLPGVLQGRGAHAPGHEAADGSGGHDARLRLGPWPPGADLGGRRGGPVVGDHDAGGAVRDREGGRYERAAEPGGAGPAAGGDGGDGGRRAGRRARADRDRRAPGGSADPWI